MLFPEPNFDYFATDISDVMMKILICAAEQEEIECAQQALRVYESKIADKVQIDFMLTGVGTTSTCYRLTKQIIEAGRNYALVINIGIAGSYDLNSFPIGSVAFIEKEFAGDLGFMTGSGFQTLFDSKTLDANLFPFIDGELRAPVLPEHFEEIAKCFKRGTGVTVQTISCSQETKRRLIDKYSPNIESMEGAGFFYVCLNEHINFMELRSVSNEVGIEDSAKWDTPAALRALTDACKLFFSKL